MLEIVVGSYEKQLLEETTLFEKENIVDVSLLLCIGKIKDIKKSKIRNVCGYNIEVKEKLDEIKQKAKKTKNIRIWYSSLDNEDVCTLYFVINYLSSTKNINIYLCNVNNGKYYSLSDYSVSEINNMIDNTIKLKKDEIKLYKNSWNRLEKENADLRINIDNELKSYNFEYLENKIIAILQEYESISYFEFVGKCLKSKLCGFYIDIVFITAIDNLIKCGRIEVCEVKQEKDFSGKLVNIKYIKVLD